MSAACESEIANDRIDDVTSDEPIESQEHFVDPVLRARLAEQRVLELEERLEQLADAYAGAERRLLERDRIVATCALFASIAHDIRSPLTALVCNLRILEDAVGESLPPTVREIFEDNRLACELIESLLVRMKTHAGRTEGPQRVRVRPIVDALVRLSRWHLSRRAVRFESRIEGDLEVHASAAEVCQILLNLLSNAADASSEGGSVRLHGFVRNERAVLAVSDDGEGISAEQAELMFVPLHSRKRDGLGVGLAMARAMARNHGGDLVLARVGGPGACFELQLPLAR